MENVKPMPRVLIAGANSGCGKTSITCGILKALVNRELHIQSYKCGPDYIDPMLHSKIDKNTFFFGIARMIHTISTQVLLSCKH